VFVIHDLPFIIALFAGIFGSLGFVALAIPALRRNIPNLVKGSFLYLATSLLLFGSIFLKQQGHLLAFAPPNLALAESSLLSKTSSEFQAQPALSSSQEQAVQTPKDQLESSLIQIDLSSDPTGADVFIDNELRGKTPLSLSLSKNTPIAYRVTASPDTATGVRFKPFEGVFDTSENSEISVWLDRIYP
jgi:hypothetical protein